MAEIKESYILEDVDLEIDGTLIGSAQSVTVNLEFDNKPTHGNGNRKPREILDGQVTINGSIERLHLDADQVKNVINLEQGSSEYFDIVGVTKNKTPQKKFAVRDAKFRGMSLSQALNEASTVSQDFDAVDFEMN